MPAGLPSLTVIDQISQLPDVVVRNLQITQCYHELSSILADRTGPMANWCTFATWASRQAGRTIRKEDLARFIQARFGMNDAALQAAQSLELEAGGLIFQPAADLQLLSLGVESFRQVLEGASDAVGRGNKKVFEEIGAEFARFFTECLDDPAPDPENIERFCEGLRAGDPPDGQEYLRRAFHHYYTALFESDPKVRAELILLANLQIGFHEQTRLQPEIAESLNAGFDESLKVTYRLVMAIFPTTGWIVLAHLVLMRLLGRPTALDRAVQALLAAVQAYLRQILTELMMTIALPQGDLRLGEDLQANFPDSLQHIENAELRSLLDQLDPTPDSVVGSGALDWADLSDRLQFIVDFFRCYQEDRDLLGPPFSPAQVEVIKTGRKPAGEL